MPRKQSDLQLFSWLLLGIIIIGLFYTSYQLVQPKDGVNSTENGVNSTEKIIAIEPGASLNQIGTVLAKEGLIRNSFFFKLYAKLKGLEEKIKAGYYRLNSGMSISTITDKLVAGDIAYYDFTVPEGMTLREIGSRLGEYKLDKDKFLEIATNKSPDWITQDKKVLYSVEGFLYPDTYHLPYGSSEEEIIDIMLQEFKAQIKSLQPKIKNSDYNLYQIITIASLIQAEAKLEEEMDLIASVIYNRLEANMKLQLDATIQYTLEERKSRLLYSDLEVKSIYNTYQHSGLPPGPINNPGLKAIKAALNPAETDYFYYVATSDGKHKFTETYQQHLKVQEKINNH
ncbi:endolytic transglycosylase MltG [Halanaerobaculum tunisiense]